MKGTWVEVTLEGINGEDFVADMLDSEFFADPVNSGDVVRACWMASDLQLLIDGAGRRVPFQKCLSLLISLHPLPALHADLPHRWGRLIAGRPRHLASPLMGEAASVSERVGVWPADERINFWTPVAATGPTLGDRIDARRSAEAPGGRVMPLPPDG
jgi:hypothetical protein